MRIDLVVACHIAGGSKFSTQILSQLVLFPLVDDIKTYMASQEFSQHACQLEIMLKTIATNRSGWKSIYEYTSLP